jgi:hypothetical protein
MHSAPSRTHSAPKGTKSDIALHAMPGKVFAKPDSRARLSGDHFISPQLWYVSG